MDADERNARSAAVLLDDLVTDPDQRAPEIVTIQDLLQLLAPLPGLTGPG
jgi:hypothetical protein